MIDYSVYSLTTFQKILFNFIVLNLSLVLSWTFYDSILFSLFCFLIIRPSQTLFRNYLQEKRQNTLLLQFKDLLYFLSSSITVGRSIGQALNEARESLKGTYKPSDYIMKELFYMTERMNQTNESDILVLEDFARRTALEDVKDFVSVCKICKETGGNLTKAIAKTTDMIADKISLERELKVIAAQKHFEGRIVGLAPFIMVLGMRIMSPEYLEPLTNTLEGRIVSTISLALIASGWIIIERMNQIDI